MSVVREEVVVAAIGDPAVSTPGARVAWGAVIAGALCAAAVSLIMVALGSGLGLTMVSPWANEGVEASTFAVSSAVWLIVMQWVAALFGGYLAGRLRGRMEGIHGDEVFFRDTAHGFLAWALATLLVAGLMTSAVGTLVGGATRAATTVAAGAAIGTGQGAAESAGEGADPTAYFADALFRPTAQAVPLPQATEPAPDDGTAARAEAGRILLTAVADELSVEDRAYLAAMVADRTGLSVPDAEARVAQVVERIEAAKTRAKEAADEARKAAATLSLFIALSLVIGAFIAAAAAALGGRQRDDFEVVATRVV